MGNCLVPQEKKVIKIMKTDGEILEYKPPLQVHQVLSEYAGHAITDTLPVARHLLPDADMRRGSLYFLLPPPLPGRDLDCKALDVRDAPMVEEGSHQGTKVVRIKLVLTKQELKEMLTKGGVSADEIISSLVKKQTVDVVGDEGNDGCRSWKPMLESIPEGNDLS